KRRSVMIPRQLTNVEAVNRCLEQHNLDKKSLQMRSSKRNGKTVDLNEEEKNCFLACKFVKFVDSLIKEGPNDVFNSIIADLHLDEERRIQLIQADSECRFE
ncbi:hypothetical protein QAD02_006346, partial [Eretmocerus hayati]